jgi:hypothetical protein
LRAAFRPVAKPVGRGFVFDALFCVGSAPRVVSPTVLCVVSPTAPCVVSPTVLCVVLPAAACVVSPTVLCVVLPAAACVVSSVAGCVVSLAAPSVRVVVDVVQALLASCRACTRSGSGGCGERRFIVF